MLGNLPTEVEVLLLTSFTALISGKKFSCLCVIKVARTLFQKMFMIRNCSVMSAGKEYGHPERAFFQKLETFGLGQTNWAEIL